MALLGNYTVTDKNGNYPYKNLSNIDKAGVLVASRKHIKNPGESTKVKFLDAKGKERMFLNIKHEGLKKSANVFTKVINDNVNSRSRNAVGMLKSKNSAKLQNAIGRGLGAGEASKNTGLGNISSNTNNVKNMDEITSGISTKTNAGLGNLD